MKINPILIKEMKVRARSVHIPVFVLLYNAVLAFVGIFMLMSSADMFNVKGYLNYGQMNEMFLTTGVIQSMMIVLVSLSVSASCFSSEKERGTLDLLLMTPVSTLEVMNGKLLSSVLTGFLFAFSSLPIMLLGTIYGGTDMTDVFYLELILILLAFAVSTRGMFWSVLFDKTSVAVGFSLLTELVFCVGPFVLLEFVHTFIYNGYQYGTIEFSAGAGCLAFQLLNPVCLILGFAQRITGGEILTDLLVYDYGIWPESGLYQWIEEYFVVTCMISQIAFTAILHLINIRILKKGRNII